MPGYATTPGNTLPVGNAQNFSGVMQAQPFAPRPTSTVILRTQKVTPPPVGRIRVWNGTVWLDKYIQVWDGSAWVPKPLKYWDGTAWVLA